MYWVKQFVELWKKVELEDTSQTILCVGRVQPGCTIVEWMRSVNAVRVYKEMSDEQQQEISYTIQAKNSENKENAPPESKKAKLEDDGSSSNKFVQTLSFNNCTVNFQYNWALLFCWVSSFITYK